MMAALNGVPLLSIGLPALDQVVRESMRSNIPRFSTRRMVKQYLTEMYAPAAAASHKKTATD